MLPYRLDENRTLGLRTHPGKLDFKLEFLTVILSSQWQLEQNRQLLAGLV